MPTLADIQAAIRERNAGRVAELLAANPALAAERPAGAPSAMLFATYMGDQAVIAVLRPKVTLSACEAAALGDTAALTKILDKDKSQANAVSGDGWPALHLAGFFGKREAVDLLLARGASVAAVSGTPDKNQALQASVAGACDAGIVQTLVAHGADVNHRGAQGITALHSAAIRGNEAMVRFLVQSGAKPSVKMEDGKTAADLARSKDHVKVADLLLDLGQGR